MEFFGSLIQFYPKSILEKFFLYIIDSLNAIKTFPELFYIILNKLFKDTLIYISGHSSLEHFQVILNVFMARLTTDESDPNDISLYFFLNFLEKALYDSSFFDNLTKMTKNTFKKSLEESNADLKRSYLLDCVLSFDIFHRLNSLSATDCFLLYEVIFRKLHSQTPQIVEDESQLDESNFILQETNAFFENSSDKLNNFAFQLYELGGFVEHLFLILISQELGLKIRKEFLEM